MPTSYQESEYQPGDLLQPQSVAEQSDADDKTNQATGANSSSSNPPSRTSRKRTKTGCLTCRKRRIKCGEERPTCSNCVKSKRVCEGYNQRVVFKVGQFRNSSLVSDSDVGMNLHDTVTLDPSGVAAAAAAAAAATATAGGGGGGGYNAPSRYPYPLQTARGPSLLQPIAPAPYPRRDDSYLHNETPPHLRAHYAEQHLQQQHYLGPASATNPSPTYFQGFQSNISSFLPGINTNIPTSSSFSSASSFQNLNSNVAISPQAQYSAAEELSPSKGYPHHNQNYNVAFPSEANHDSTSESQQESQQHQISPSTISSATFQQQDSANRPPPSIGYPHYNQSYNAFYPSATSRGSTSESHQEPQQRQILPSTISSAAFQQQDSAYPPTRRMSAAAQSRQLSQASSHSTPSSTSYPPMGSAGNVVNLGETGQNSLNSEPYSASTVSGGNININNRLDTGQLSFDNTYADYYNNNQEQVKDAASEDAPLTNAITDEFTAQRPSISFDPPSLRDIEQYDDNLTYIGGVYIDKIEDEDDDFDDEMMGMDIMPRAAISAFLAPHAQAAGQRISFRSFIPEPGELATYHPSAQSSPLMDPTTARIFCHWVYVVAPTISIFERHPPNPQVAFTPGAAHNGPQNVFAYTISMLSLSSSVLLHALLALSSLHIARVANESFAPPHIHYHLALRRLRRALEDKKQRAAPATLAASLLLAYYELMSADVFKWVSHIQGSRDLLREIDFDHIVDRLETVEEQEMQYQHGDDGSDNREQISNRINMKKARRKASNLQREPHVDMTGHLLGSRGRKGSSSTSGKKSNSNEKRDLETCLLQSDLFWWFAKMDAYQAIISGGALTLDYAYWGQCLPRAHIGTLGTSYGSSDQLYLLWGRIADFASRDTKRKREVEKNGPAPAMLEFTRQMGPRGPSGPSAVGASGSQNKKDPPKSSGNDNSSSMQDLPRRPKEVDGLGETASEMASMPPGSEYRYPSTNNPKLPKGLDYEGGKISKEDIEAATVEAELEWIEICQALQLFQESLNEEFQQLDEDLMPPLSSPFGNAVFYRTHSIATLQLLFKTAQIILERVHPSMPSNAMVAASIVARKTALRANEICRIGAGMLPPLDTDEISPSLGGALTELSLCFLFAGVQCQDPIQRDWLIDHMIHIADVTGWGTANRVVAACQHAWMKMAEAGKGPPYAKPEQSLIREGIIDSDDSESNKYIWRNPNSRAHWAVGVLGDRMESVSIQN